jgi:hypothetical protein
MGTCDLCGDSGQDQKTRTYKYSEDELVIFSTEICDSCADEVLPVFFDAVGYGEVGDRTLDWPRTASRDYSDPEPVSERIVSTTD